MKLITLSNTPVLQDHVARQETCRRISGMPRASRVYHCFIILVNVVGSSLFAQVASTQYLTETRQDVETALYNPYMLSGTPVETVAGMQRMPGSIPKDLAMNQETYNDIAALRGQILTLKDMISKAGVRYNFANEFQLLNVQLDTIGAQLENALRTKLVQ